MTKKFTRTIEDFTCEHCGAKVQGSGYTNHCPVCLWSKHVDNNPGDRENPCQGMMQPIGVELNHGEYILHHRCQTCGMTKRNKTSPDDSMEVILALTQQK